MGHTDSTLDLLTILISIAFHWGSVNAGSLLVKYFDKDKQLLEVITLTVGEQPNLFVEPMFQEVVQEHPRDNNHMNDKYLHYWYT